MTKLKIDLRAGTLEVEGEEAFVREIYKDYKDKITEGFIKNPLHIPDPSAAPNPKENTGSPVIRTSSAKSTGKRKESYQIVKDLDLSSKNGKEELKAFYTKKAPSNAMERNTVFVYYLERIANVSNINTDHVYTCYKNVGEKVPGALRQSLLDTSSRKGWIDTKLMENIKLSIHGENLVEHELPVVVENKKQA